jgi:ATP-binding cassette, subfamily B, bacterial
MTQKSTTPIAQKRTHLSSFTFLFQYIRPYTGLVVLGLMSILIIALTTLAMGFGIKSLVNEGFQKQYIRALLFMTFIVLVFGIATYYRYLAMSALSEKIVGDIRRTMYQHTLTLDPVFFEQLSIGEILSRITVDTTFIQHLVSTTFPIALRNLLMAISGCFTLYLINTDLAYLLMVLLPIILIILHRLGRRIRKFSANTQALVGHANEYLEETLNAVRTAQAFCHEELTELTSVYKLELY